MSFIMASKCEKYGGRGTRSPFKNVKIIVGVSKGEKENRYSVSVSIRPEVCAEAWMKSGDGIDIGIDPGSLSMMLKFIPELTPAPCHLHKHSGDLTSTTCRLKVKLSVRSEWNMRNLQNIPQMPATHEIIERGQIIFRLPQSWERFWK